jgi:transposase
MHEGETTKVKDLRDWHTVKNMYNKGVPIKQIARELKMSKNTVKSLIKKEEEPKYIRETRTTKIDGFKDDIRKWYLEKEYSFNGTRIYNELNKLGYSGTINPIYRYLSSLDDERILISKRASQRFETPPGDQAQFDWGEYEVIVTGKRTKIYCFTMVLSYSRKKAAVCSLSVTAAAIYEAIQDLFIELGGVTKELLIDNPKALVISHKKDEEVIFNEGALKLVTYLKTELNACLPLRPRTKGKIEKPNQYIEEQFIKGSSFNSMEELNFEIKHFMRNWNKKIHGTTRRVPDEMFEQERGSLISLNARLVMDLELEERIVSTDSFVMINTNRYSVPVKYVDRKVRVRIVYGYRLEIFDLDLVLIKNYPLLDGRYDKHEDPTDYEAIASKVPRSIPEIKRVFEGTFKHGSEFYELASKVTRQAHFHAREFLKLKDLYSVEDLDIILKHCVQNNIFKIETMKSVIKEKYLELIIEHDKTQLSLLKKNDNKHSLKNEKEIVRDLSYYGKGDSYDS